jgi:hypothetical protein
MARKKDYLLRIDADLWDEIQRWAADDLRSVNGQIEYILRRAVSQHRRDIPLPEESKKQNPGQAPP